MATKKSTAVLALTGTITQDKIPAMLEVINQKITNLKGDKEKAARVTGTLGAFGRVSDITNPDTLRDAYAYITRKGEAIEGYNEVFKKVAPTAKFNKYKEGGATVEQWQEEILTQYRDVTFKEELTKLQEAKKLLEENLSEELKFQARIQSVADLLSTEV